MCATAASIIRGTPSDIQPGQVDNFKLIIYVDYYEHKYAKPEGIGYEPSLCIVNDSVTFTLPVHVLDVKSR